MAYVFYDTETTGIDTSFDQILQFGGIRTDDELNELERFGIRCRLLPHVVPAPKALQMTGVVPDMLTDPALPSHYQAMRRIHARLSAWSPAVFAGYNSLSFDEAMLRQAFYQTLQPVYLTNSGGNARADVLRLVRATALYAPNALVVPLAEDGWPVFRLDRLAPANGFDHANAHDAMADVEATIFMAKLVRDRAPDVWDHMMALSARQNVIDTLGRNKVIALTEFYRGLPNTWLVTECGENPGYPAERAVFDLSRDPAGYIGLSAEEIATVLKESPGVIRILRANAQPVLMPADLCPHEIMEKAPAAAELERRAGLIGQNPAFRQRVGEALAGRFADREPSPHVEQQIYEGFPSEADIALMRRFHEVAWKDRPAIVHSLGDPRLRRLAQRLIYFERPDVLPADTRAALDAEIADHLNTHRDDVPWRTVPQAKRELESLAARAPTEDIAGFADALRRFYDERLSRD